MGNTLHGNLALSREQLSQENGDAYFPTGETSNDPSNNYPDATNDESFTNTPFLDRLKGEKVRGSITVPNNQGMGVFSVKQRGEKPSGAANLMKSRISAQPMNTTGNTRFVGSELKPNQTLQEQAARMARDAELWRAALSLGVNCYRDGNGELVFEMPKNIIAEIEEKANEKANYQLESSKLTIKNEVLERFKSLSKYTIRFALLQERAKKIASTEGNQKDISTLQWMLDTASKENPSNEEVTLTLIENNLAALEENIAQGESVVAEQEAARSREEQEQAANLIHEKEAALKAQKEAEETLAKERTLHQAERKLLEEFASLYASFLETESRSRKLRPSLDEKIGESLTEAARELNILKPELIRKPSEEILSTWKEKLTAFTSFVDSLEKTLTGTNPSEQNNESFSPLTIHSGWPSNIKTDNGNWLLIKKDGASVTLDNNALWSTLASHFDDTFKTYQNFFEGNDANQKIKNYHGVIELKRQLITALLELDTEHAGNVLKDFDAALEEAEHSWMLIVQNKNEEERKRTEKNMLLGHVNKYNSQVSDLLASESTLQPFTGKEGGLISLQKAKDVMLEKQQQIKNCIDKKELLTEALTEEFKKAIDDFSSLLLSLQKEKAAILLAEQVEQERLGDLVAKEKERLVKMETSVRGFIDKVDSPSEKAMILENLKTSNAEKATLEESLSKNKLVEEAIVLFRKHLSDLGGMLERVENRITDQIKNKDRDPAEISVNQPEASAERRDISLGKNGRLVEDKDTTGNPQTIAAKAITERDKEGLLNFFQEEFNGNQAGFLNEYSSGKWDGDPNEMVVKKVVERHIDSLKEQKAALEIRLEKEPQHSESLTEQINILDEKIKALTRSNSPLPKAGGEISIVGSRQSPMKPNFGRNTKLKTGTQNQNRGENIPSENLSVSEVMQPTANDVVTPLTTRSNIDSEPQHQPSQDQLKKKQGSVTKLTNILFADARLNKIIGPVPLGNQSVAHNQQSVTKPKTLGSTTSWRDFIEGDSPKTFVEDLVDRKIGLAKIITTYAKSVNIDPKNPALLSNVINSDVYTVIHGEENPYGISAEGRGELSELIKNLATVIASADIHTRTPEKGLPNDILALVPKATTLEEYYAEALKMGEQATNREQAAKDTSYNGHTLRKAA